MTVHRYEQLRRTVHFQERGTAYSVEANDRIIVQRGETMGAGAAKYIDFEEINVKQQPRHIQNAMRKLEQVRTKQIRILSDEELNEILQKKKMGPNSRNNLEKRGKTQNQNRSKNENHTFDTKSMSPLWQSKKENERTGISPSSRSL